MNLPHFSHLVNKVCVMTVTHGPFADDQIHGVHCVAYRDFKNFQEYWVVMCKYYELAYLHWYLGSTRPNTPRMDLIL